MDRLEKRRVRFEEQFAPNLDNLSPVLREIAQAKYAADETLFNILTFLEQIEARLELRYASGRLAPAAAFPETKPLDTRPRFPLTFEDARLKIDCRLTDGQPYVGLRLVLPFGG
jgi:hypothetical protein